MFAWPVASFPIATWGKASFSTSQTLKGASSAFLNPKTVGDDAFDTFKQLDLGDWIGVEGKTFTTKMGEPTVRVSALTVLCKTMRPHAGQVSWTVGKRNALPAALPRSHVQRRKPSGFHQAHSHGIGDSIFLGGKRFFGSRDAHVASGGRRRGC